MAYLAGLVGPVGLGALLYLGRGHLAAADLALIFVLSTVAVASAGYVGPAVVAALSSSGSFDFFCTKPYLSLRIAASRDVTTTVLLLAVSLVVAGLALRARRSRLLALAQADRLQRLHDLGERIATGDPADVLLLAVCHELRDLLCLRECRFTRSDEHVAARIEHDGSVTLNGMGWQAERLGLPTGTVALPVRVGGEVRGTFLLIPTPAVPVGPEARLAAVTLAEQVGPVLPKVRA